VRNSKIKDFKIDILLSPFDSQKTIKRIISVAENLLKIQRETDKIINLYLSPLVSYP